MDKHVKIYPGGMRYTFALEAHGDKTVLRATKEGKDSNPVTLKFLLDADDCESLAAKFDRAAKVLRSE
ncbi:MAG: hypothetical protein BWY99_02347 [Synergistetes bacterium ADurb.BinA166]|nr:MAG: hypothetical protein BWY99_02347 [Synergistetes bacterium ADurb.BinA166]